MAKRGKSREKPEMTRVPIDDLRLVKAVDADGKSNDITVTEYEIEVEDHGPDQTCDGQVVLYFGFNNSNDAHPLTYRSRVKFNSGHVRITIYADELLDVEVQNGIYFINRRPN